MGKAEIGERAFKHREAKLKVPTRDPALAHPDYRDGGPKGGYRNLREHQEGLLARQQRRLTRKEAAKIWPPEQVAAYFG